MSQEMILNDRQKEAINHKNGPLLILAGAGSGKTRVVTYKIYKLIQQEDAKESDILAITFTNKAAKEMKERVSKYLEKNIDNMWIGTFHSIGVRILRRDIGKIGYEKNFAIYDRDDQITLIKEILKELDIDSKSISSSYIASQISKFKNNNLGPDDLKEFCEMDDYEKIVKIYDKYERKLKEYNALDFDDLIIKTVYLLEKEKGVLDYYTDKFKYVFVDEYQDTNSMQYKLVKLLSSKYNNICVVGDIDQSIYKWRGADISNILNFEKDFKDAEVIILEQNYRSTKNILSVANELIKNNINRREKILWTDNEEGQKVRYYKAATQTDEAYIVSREVKSLISQGYKASDIVVLYRTNAQSRSLEEAFMRMNIAYNIVGGIRFYDRKEVKDILSYFKFINNNEDFISLKRIINTPKRGIGEKTLMQIKELNDNGFTLMSAMKNSRSENVKDFYNIINELSDLKDKLSIGELYDNIIDKSSYIKSLEDERTIEAKTRIENLYEFRNIISEYEENYDNMSLEDFLSEISLMTDLDRTEENKGNMVTFSTMHSAKGLEYDVVFVVGMENGLFPSSLAIEEKNVEEERRLCYVAFTRASKELILLSADSRLYYGKIINSIPSMFIEEIKDKIKVIKKDNDNGFNYTKEQVHYKTKEFFIGKLNIINNEMNKNIKKDDFKVGDKVKHKAFGIGLIVQIKGKNLTISFPEKGIKNLSVDYAPISKVVD